ncbi:hypothetical protein MXB_423 [Myxobolus squamalis]|nr:hypothetical protein MXB_423 [Myxobolus squamalis]
MHSNAHIIDIETSKRVAQFSNEKMTSLPRMNGAVINYNDSLLLFNGGLFCIRSGRFIHIFPELDQHISGNFVHSDTKALINCQLVNLMIIKKWDLRTLKLYNRMEKFRDFVVKKTHSDEILMGIKLQKSFKINSSEDQFAYWVNYIVPYQNSLAIYDMKYNSKIPKIKNIENDLIKYNFDTYIEFAHISRDGTKIAVGVIYFHTFNHSLITEGMLEEKTTSKY